MPGRRTPENGWRTGPIHPSPGRPDPPLLPARRGSSRPAAPHRPPADAPRCRRRCTSSGLRDRAARGPAPRWPVPTGREPWLRRAYERTRASRRARHGIARPRWFGRRATRRSPRAARRGRRSGSATRIRRAPLRQVSVSVLIRRQWPAPAGRRRAPVPARSAGRWCRRARREADRSGREPA